MANKITLQQLAKALAQKKNIPQKDAETFLKEFFDSIVQNVTTDKLVKIKGLGTFKLIEVLDRESVNVNTVERIVIPGHSKLSFIPETALKDLINKPFADFQTTVINEGTSIEEMEWVPQEATQTSQPSPEKESEADDKEHEVAEQPVQAFTPVSEPEPEPTPEPETPEPEVKEEQKEEEVVPEPEVKPEVKEEPIPEPAVKPEVKEEPKPTPEPEPAPAPEPSAKEEPTGSSPSGDGKGHRLWAWALGLLLLCVIVFFAARSLTQKSANVEPAAAEPQVETPVEAPAPKVEYAQVPGGEYRIVGTRKTHVMKPGEFITRIAIQEYGDKDFAPYIIVHNAFPDPDNVPVDMEIKLPELEKIE